MSALCLLLTVFAASVYSGHCSFIPDLVKKVPLDFDPCSECSQIVELSANMIPSRDTKETVYRTLHALCQRLPQDQASNCDLQVKMFLPKILQQTPGQLQPGDSCMAFGLCGAHKEEPLTLPHRATHEDTPSSALGSADRSHALFNPACALCLFVIKKLESLLPTNVTEDALIKLMGEVCDLLPESYKDQCDDFIAKYGTQIVEFLLSSAAPHTICMLLHVCLYEEQAVPEPSLPSDCESCRTLAVLSRLNNGPNSTQPETSSFLQSVCVHYPNAIPKCEAFTKIYGPQLQKVFGNQMGSKHVCETAELCVPQQKVEPLGKERCTWGPSYWCKDVQTAQRCGNLAFCEKFMWKE
ncbi:surfactant protein Bb [Takifugu rubripes]|uniref:Surfactant protein Bb n=1 Tax=Takifugu rubripes TaxID=31033 RepID=A0A3B5K583_TAKRU|nr:prosaposin-like [Takifugu rubripes]|eukprot:XP_011613996.1 PREDICTED: prosaposin-like [Takifugu rubripes]